MWNNIIVICRLLSCFYLIVNDPNFILNFCFGMMYMDFASGILHIVLDNEDNISIPILREYVKDFLDHHKFPKRITEKSYSEVVNETFIASLYLLIVCRKNLILYGHLSLFFIVGQSWHRYAHKKTNTWIGWHHRLHHMTYDRNFAIVCGITNPVINIIYSYTKNRWFYLSLLIILFNLPILI